MLLIAAFGLFLGSAVIAKVQTGGTGRATVFGEIEDFGSIVVNGVHYDETHASISIDGISGQSKSALKLGMIVQIDGVQDYANSTGIAESVRVNSVLRGQIESINLASGEIVVLQQRIAITPTTRFDAAGGLLGVTIGDWVGVHGLEDAGRKSVTATLIESLSISSELQSTIRGTVSNVNEQRVRIGALDILWNGNTPHNGEFVAVTGYYNGRELTASQLLATKQVELHEAAETEIEGFVQDFRGVSNFTIAGVTIDASTAQFIGGRAGNLNRDIRVTVEGPVVNGVLIAEEVIFPGAGASSASSEKIELEGSITTFNSIADFVVKGQRIDASGVASGLKRPPALGWKAHVKGTMGADGKLVATSAEFERR